MNEMCETYDDVLLLAGELVGAAEVRLELNPMDRAEMYLLAGFLRGLLAAGEPINGQRMTYAIKEARRYTSVYSRQHY